MHMMKVFANKIINIIIIKHQHPCKFICIDLIWIYYIFIIAYYYDAAPLLMLRAHFSEKVDVWWCCWWYDEWCINTLCTLMHLYAFYKKIIIINIVWRVFILS